MCDNGLLLGVPMTVSKLTYAWCQMTQRDGDGPEADAIALFTSKLTVVS